MNTLRLTYHINTWDLPCWTTTVLWFIEQWKMRVTYFSPPVWNQSPSLTWTCVCGQTMWWVHHSRNTKPNRTKPKTKQASKVTNYCMLIHKDFVFSSTSRWERTREYICIHVHLPVVWTEWRVWGIPLGAFPAHEIPLKLFHCLQSLPLAGKRLHLTAWGTGQDDWVVMGVRERQGVKLGGDKIGRS